MPACQKADENAVDYILLTDDDLGDFLAHLIEVASCELERGLGRHLPILAVRRVLR